MLSFGFDSSGQPSHKGFNGAAAGRPRRGGGDATGGVVDQASIGPRLEGRGELGGGCGGRRHHAALKGPRLEGRGEACNHRRRNRRRVASMGPRLEGREERITRAFDSASGLNASMGPRLEGRGESITGMYP